MVELFGHPFSSYTWKALIPLYENATPFVLRVIDDQHPDNVTRLRAHSPVGKFPLLVDGDTVLFESSVIIEYLQQKHSGPVKFLPEDQALKLEVRMMDRFFDNYVMGNMQVVVDDALRPAEHRCPAIVEAAKNRLRQAYVWLDDYLRGRTWACGEAFSLADCAAAPSLFYADWVDEIAPALENLRQYRARLLARPSMARCVDDARPYRQFFPLGAPDRD
ncbi:MAG TPA: glutathione S-transferase family protein [Porticoccaceae bacterium]